MKTELSKIEFTTARLFVQGWQAHLRDPLRKTIMENQISKILTPKITRYLPQSMQFAADRDSISQWISDLDNEASVLCAHSLESDNLVGLIILSLAPTSNPVPEVHLGYFFGESDWGKGYATELITSLISAFEKGTPTRLVAGVDQDNIASQRVLEKSGFNRIVGHSGGSQHMFEITVP